jgi:hypothetical protein
MHYIIHLGSFYVYACKCGIAYYSWGHDEQQQRLNQAQEKVIQLKCAKLEM